MRAVAQPVAEAQVAAGLSIWGDSARVPGAQAVPRLSRVACSFAGTTQLSLAPSFLDVKMDSCLSCFFPSLMKPLIFHSVLLFCGLDLIIMLDQHLFLQATLGH